MWHHDSAWQHTAIRHCGHVQPGACGLEQQLPTRRHTKSDKISRSHPRGTVGIAIMAGIVEPAVMAQTPTAAE
jgi:hypothetical protein